MLKNNFFRSNRWIYFCLLKISFFAPKLHANVCVFFFFLILSRWHLYWRIIPLSHVEYTPCHSMAKKVEHWTMNNDTANQSKTAIFSCTSIQWTKHIHSFTKITKQRLAQPTQRPIMSDWMCETFRKLIIVVRVFYCLQLNTIYNVMDVIKSWSQILMLVILYQHQQQHHQQMISMISYLFRQCKQWERENEEQKKHHQKPKHTETNGTAHSTQCSAPLCLKLDFRSPK